MVNHTEIAGITGRSKTHLVLTYVVCIAHRKRGKTSIAQIIPIVHSSLQIPKWGFRMEFYQSFKTWYSLDILHLLEIQFSPCK